MKNEQTAIAKVASVLLLLSMSVFLLLAQTSFWVNHSVFDSERFAKLATQGFLAPQSRDAVAQIVVERTFEGRPIAQRLLSTRSESLVSAILGTDLSQQTLDVLSRHAYQYVITPDRRDLTIDLAGIKAPINALMGVVQQFSNTTTADTDKGLNVPDQIVLLKSDAVPDLSQYVLWFLWVGPLMWLGFVVCVGLLIWYGRDQLTRRIQTIAWTVFTTCALAVLILWLLPVPLSAILHNTALHPIAQSIIGHFARPLIIQLCVTFVMVLLVLVGWRRYSEKRSRV